jgi:thioredoxin-dependent peroxiredoxin
MPLKGGAIVGIFSMLGLGAAGADIQEGMKAPAFTAKDQSGKAVQLADFKGKSNVVLYFYPKDDTPGCTKEACSLRDGFGAIQAAGAAILGVSADDEASHKAFAEKYHLPFSLLADPGKAIIEAYGVKMPVVGLAKRVTFVIDKQGTVRKVLTDVDTAGHDRQVLEILKTLK